MDKNITIKNIISLIVITLIIIFIYISNDPKFYMELIMLTLYNQFWDIYNLYNNMDSIIIETVYYKKEISDMLFFNIYDLFDNGKIVLVTAAAILTGFAVYKITQDPEFFKVIVMNIVNGNFKIISDAEGFEIIIPIPSKPVESTFLMTDAFKTILMMLNGEGRLIYFFDYEKYELKSIFTMIDKSLYDGIIYKINTVEIDKSTRFLENKEIIDNVQAIIGACIETIKYKHDIYSHIFKVDCLKLGNELEASYLELIKKPKYENINMISDRIRQLVYYSEELRKLRQIQ